MKISGILTTLGVLFIVLLFSGCTSTSPQVTPQTTVPTLVTTPQTTPTLLAPVVATYPDALPLGQYATFGSGDRQGTATVYKYKIMPNYNWTAPSFNSVGEQLAASQPNELQRGYNMEKPRDGNTFMFIYVRVVNTGEKAVNAPSPMQFVVVSDGMRYNYTSVHSSDVVIDMVSETQYDYQIGRGGVVGYVQPGESNKADGYLIYEVPAAISLNDTYVIVNLDYQTQAVWRFD